MIKNVLPYYLLLYLCYSNQVKDFAFDLLPNILFLILSKYYIIAICIFKINRNTRGAWGGTKTGIIQFCCDIVLILFACQREEKKLIT